MLSISRRLIAVFCPVLLCLNGMADEARTPEYAPQTVVVVANRAAADSKAIARFYMKMREIPDNNLILVDAPISEHISRQAYLDTLHNPILTQLLERGLVDAFEGPPDELGRKTVSIFKNKVRYLVLCMGIPSKVNKTVETEADRAYLKKYFALSNPSMIETFSSGKLAKNEASVDGELALLLERNTPLRGFVPNPLYGNGNRDVLTDVLRVTRLDGPSYRAVIRMLNSSWKGEQNGLRGRAYVDEDGRGGSFQIGNDWMKNTAELFSKMGFDTSHNTVSKTFSDSDRFDAPVLYAGWYSANCDGPFTLPGFKFPDGAVAAHLHSYSASTMRSTSKRWVGPFVERGVACTFGNVSEPYLQFTHKFDAFFAALARGWNFADAAYYALPGLSWQAVAVGDPLYRPFARTLDEELASSAGSRHDQGEPYLFIRKANLLMAEEKPEQAIGVMEQAFKHDPDPALALALARLYLQFEQHEEALATLASVEKVIPRESTSWGLHAEIADELYALGEMDSAVEVYANLISRKLPESVLQAYLHRGVKAAEAAGQPKLATRWRTKLNPSEAINESN